MKDETIKRLSKSRADGHQTGLFAEALQFITAGIPLLTLLILAVAIIWVYQFWRIGWIAWSGNLRFAAWVGLGLGVATMVFGPCGAFGMRSRKQGAILSVVAVALWVLFWFGLSKVHD